jgi:hypothetical protein
MTLSRWLRDDFYFSLGGTGAGPSAPMNLMLVMLLGGSHGAAYVHHLGRAARRGAGAQRLTGMTHADGRPLARARGGSWWCRRWC